MTQRDTVTVAVLFMKPAFVTTPRNDMGGMLRSKNSAMIWTDQVACPATASFVAAPHATQPANDRLPFWGMYLSLLLIDNFADFVRYSPLPRLQKGFDRNTANIARCGPSMARPTVGYHTPLCARDHLDPVLGIITVTLDSLHCNSFDSPRSAHSRVMCNVQPCGLC